MRLRAHLLVPLALAALLAVPGAASAAFPGANGRIAFERPGVGIFDAAADGSGVRQLTSNPCDSHPSYSPDGLTIVFDSCGKLFAITSGGEARRELPTRLPNPQRPVFGPGGTQIALQAGRFSTGIYTQALDGSGVRTLASHAYGPAWSPLAGGPLEFSVPVRDAEWCNSTSLEDLWSVPATGGRRARVTKNFASYDPDFSPDGRSVAFTRDLTASTRDLTRVKGVPDCRRALPRVRSAGSYGEEIFVARADGRGLRRLTKHGGRAPAWSPDGTQIAFDRRPYVYAISASGGGARRIARGRNPTWQPAQATSVAPGPFPPLP